jgi:hypothetical protein
LTLPGGQTPLGSSRSIMAWYKASHGDTTAPPKAKDHEALIKASHRGTTAPPKARDHKGKLYSKILLCGFRGAVPWCEASVQALQYCCLSHNFWGSRATMCAANAQRLRAGLARRVLCHCPDAPGAPLENTNHHTLARGHEPGAYAAVPMPMATAFTSAPTFSQSLANSLMQVIFTTRKALAAYCIICADSSPVSMKGVSFRYSTRYRLRMSYKARSESSFRRYPHTQPYYRSPPGRLPTPSPCMDKGLTRRHKGHKGKPCSKSFLAIFVAFWLGVRHQYMTVFNRRCPSF